MLAKAIMFVRPDHAVPESIHAGQDINFNVTRAHGFLSIHAGQDN